MVLDISKFSIKIFEGDRQNFFMGEFFQQRNNLCSLNEKDSLIMEVINKQLSAGTVKV